MLAKPEFVEDGGLAGAIKTKHEPPGLAILEPFLDNTKEAAIGSCCQNCEKGETKATRSSPPPDRPARLPGRDARVFCFCQVHEAVLIDSSAQGTEDA
jgi:hypothetical protein